MFALHPSVGLFGRGPILLNCGPIAHGPVDSRWALPGEFSQAGLGGGEYHRSDSLYGVDSRTSAQPPGQGAELHLQSLICQSQATETIPWQLALATGRPELGPQWRVAWLQQ